jgi:hypothetical protein
MGVAIPDEKPPGVNRAVQGSIDVTGNRVRSLAISPLG